MDEFKLDGEVGFVTGGNGGIGRGIALGLARAGADVVLAARDADKLESTRKEIEGLGRRCLALRCDVNQRADVTRALEAAREGLGPVSILVNNAGVARMSPPEKLSEADWDDVLDTNLKATFVCSQLAHPHMRERGRGKVINIGSEYAIFGSPLVPSYAASKGGVIQLTKSLAVAWARHRIQVNAIIPGWITTDMTAPVKEMGELYDAIVARTPSGRFGEPEELAGAAVFLASRASDFITGQSIVVDGGYSVS
jgi:2-deoxy-D-gluconate 3-dehydrogenase